MNYSPSVSFWVVGFRTHLPKIQWLLVDAYFVFSWRCALYCDTFREHFCIRLKFCRNFWPAHVLVSSNLISVFFHSAALLCIALKNHCLSASVRTRPGDDYWNRPCGAIVASSDATLPPLNSQEFISLITKTSEILYQVERFQRDYVSIIANLIRIAWNFPLFHSFPLPVRFIHSRTPVWRSFIASFIPAFHKYTRE